MGSVKFKKAPSQDFLGEVKKRVEEERQRRGITRFATSAVWVKVWLILFGYIVGCALLFFVPMGGLGVYLTYLFLGVVKAFNGLNIAHDANHSTLSKQAWVNRLFASLFDLSSTSSSIWKLSHNNGHHIYTNIAGVDADIHKSPFLRLNPYDEKRWFHRYQHLYAPFLYMISTLNWAFISDISWYFKEGLPRNEAILFWLFKAVNLVLFLILPLLILPVPAWVVIVGFLSVHFVAGILTAVVFQIAHVVEEVECLKPEVDGELPYSWAEHEMRTTCNAATKSKFVTTLVGGLNHQVEHHLFPDYCHVHYHWIAPIVKKTAKEFSVPYLENRTFFGAVASHFRTLKRLGRE